MSSQNDRSFKMNDDLHLVSMIFGFQERDLSLSYFDGNQLYTTSSTDLNETLNLSRMHNSTHPIDPLIVDSTQIANSSKCIDMDSENNGKISRRQGLVFT